MTGRVRLVTLASLMAVSAALLGAQGRAIPAEVDAAFQWWWAAADPRAARAGEIRVSVGD